MAKELRKLIQNLNQVLKSDRVLRTALTTTLAEHKQRIFTDGKDSTGGKIGSYSTDPIYISNKSSARKFSGKGRFFKGGYNQYKQAIGKNPGFVNLENTGNMMKDYTLLALGKKWGFGFNNSKNADLSYYNEEHFNKKIFELTSEEEDLLIDSIEEKLWIELQK